MLSEGVCAELERLRSVLGEAGNRGYRFHFIEAEPGESLVFAGPALRGWPRNKQMQGTKPAPATNRGLRR